MTEEYWRRITKGERWGYWVEVGHGIERWSDVRWRPTFEGAERTSYGLLRKYKAWKTRTDWEVTYDD